MIAFFSGRVRNTNYRNGVIVYFIVIKGGPAAWRGYHKGI